MMRVYNATFLMKPLLINADPRTRRQLLAWRQQAQSDKAPRVALRLQALLLSADGHTPPHIAQLLHVHRSRVHQWVRNWMDHGIDGIKEGHRSGRRPALSDAQRQQLHDLIESGPVAYGLNTGVWTSKIVAELIQEEYGVAFHPGHVRKLLHRAGCSVQRPTTRLVQADPQAQRRWTRYTYPNLKKTPRPKVR
jgi:transposase